VPTSCVLDQNLQVVKPEQIPIIEKDAQILGIPKPAVQRAAQILEEPGDPALVRGRRFVVGVRVADENIVFRPWNVSHVSRTRSDLIPRGNCAADSCRLAARAGPSTELPLCAWWLTVRELRRWVPGSNPRISQTFDGFPAEPGNPYIGVIISRPPKNVKLLLAPRHSRRAPKWDWRPRAWHGVVSTGFAVERLTDGPTSDRHRLRPRKHRTIVSKAPARLASDFRGIGKSAIIRPIPRFILVN